VQVVRKRRGKVFLGGKAPGPPPVSDAHVEETCTTVEVATEVTEAGPSKKRKWRCRRERKGEVGDGDG